jgi:hypothetical protein
MAIPTRKTESHIQNLVFKFSVRFRV